MRKLALVILILVFAFLEVFASRGHCLMELDCSKSNSVVAYSDDIHSADNSGLLRLDFSPQHGRTQSDKPLSPGACAVCSHCCTYPPVNNPALMKPETSVFLAEFLPTIVGDVFLPLLIRPPII